jgi:hypothetical protein
MALATLGGLLVGGGEFCEPGCDLVHETGVFAFVRRGDRVVGRVAGVGEVVGARGEGARHHDRRVDPESSQLGGVADRE